MRERVLITATSSNEILNSFLFWKKKKRKRKTWKWPIFFINTDLSFDAKVPWDNFIFNFDSSYSDRKWKQWNKSIGTIPSKSVDRRQISRYCRNFFFFFLSLSKSAQILIFFPFVCFSEFLKIFATQQIRIEQISKHTQTTHTKWVVKRRQQQQKWANKTKNAMIESKTAWELNRTFFKFSALVQVYIDVFDIPV